MKKSSVQVVFTLTLLACFASTGSLCVSDPATNAGATAKIGRIERCLLVAAGSDAVGTTVKVDPDTAIGPVKPVNGVGQPPLVGKLGSWSMMHYLKGAGIPYARLHDVGGWLGGGMFVDVPNLFPNFDADENDPANYRFAYTDSLLKALEANGVEPFFRLGVTIENFVGYKDRLPPVNIVPPKDFGKWARICEHVIRHYTEGWADGLKMKIDHWEIWNEPDNFPDPMDNCMWRGDWESYMRFYGVVSMHLKSKFPHLRIGGYGSCGFYAAVGANHVKAANSSPRMTYFVDCFTNFLVRAKSERWPLDFFSFHSYSLPDEARRQVAYARETLDAYGFKDTTMIFDEWLPAPSHKALGTARQAALVAAELIDLQNGPCAVACIYDARCGVGDYSPLFNPLTCEPHKAYYAFMAFNELRKRGTAVKVSVSSGGKYAADVVRAAAAKGADGSMAVMIVNVCDEEKPFSLCMGRALRSQSFHCRITDVESTWEETALPSTLPPQSILLVVSSAAPATGK